LDRDAIFDDEEEAPLGPCRIFSGIFWIDAGRNAGILSENNLRGPQDLMTPENPCRALRPRLLLLPAILLTLWVAGCASTTPADLLEPTVVEAACGECLFGMPGKGCDLAVRIGGRSYYVDGIDMDSLGDAHGQEGLCKVVRKAKITGQFRGHRLAATSFELLPSGR
jgi:hypothetical protein